MLPRPPKQSSTSSPSCGRVSQAPGEPIILWRKKKAAKWPVLLIGTKRHSIFYWQSRSVLDCHGRAHCPPRCPHHMPLCAYVCGTHSCSTSGDTLGGVHVFTRMWRPQVNIKCLPHSPSTLLRQGLSTEPRAHGSVIVDCQLALGSP